MNGQVTRKGNLEIPPFVSNACLIRSVVYIQYERKLGKITESAFFAIKNLLRLRTYKESQRLQIPLFIVSVRIMIFKDWIAPAANDVAGKSDFCAHSQVLYAFILMLSVDLQHEMYMLLINE